MPVLGKRSKKLLKDADPRIVEILEEAIKHYDFSVIETHRSNERQEELYKNGKTKVRAGGSKHNAYPSLAVDIAPYPIDWDDINRFVYLAGVVQTIANQKGYKLRWGGNWDMDYHIMSDQRFNDLPHFEIVD